MNAQKDFISGTLTRESLEYALEQYVIQEAMKTNDDGFVVGPSHERERATYDLATYLSKRFL